MYITKVTIKSFKSISDSTIDFNHNCIGLVGVNESGKTNLLNALSKIDSFNELEITEKTKDSDEFPCITFTIKFEPNDIEIIKKDLKEYSENNTIGYVPILEKDLNLIYKISCSNDGEERGFSLEGLKPSKDCYFLKDKFVDIGYKIPFHEESKTLTELKIIHKEQYEEINRNFELNLQIKEIEEKLEFINNKKIEKPNEIIKETDDLKDSDNKSSKNEEKETLSQSDKSIAKMALMEKRMTLSSKISFNLLDLEETIKKKIINEKTKLVSIAEKIVTIDSEIAKLTEEKDSEIILLKKKKKKNNQDLVKKYTTRISQLNFQLENIFISQTNNYNQYPTQFKNNIANELDLSSFVPKMIFWENEDKYILPSSIKLVDLIGIKNDKDIPRPLINMFRIAIGIETIGQFKSILTEVISNGSKRSSINAKLNEKVNNYIKEVWEEYDQRMQISLEESQIRIEIFDPKRDSDAGFYELQERSQGCKSFLSFILTIGAESKTNLIHNQLLLLDEPESHLHPSGQRFMLKELRNISNRNQVVYATHSNHMIIRDNYNQHFIIKKEKDTTNIMQSKSERIGYFMQEEVLYDAMGVDLSSDLSTIEDFNFVFEGVGDLILFKHYFEKILSAEDRPFKMSKTKFYHGGKCMDIKKAFTRRPIQLGTKWVFIIDSDKPAEALKKFISGKYKPYLDKDIFIFQYNTVNKVEELEDLLPIDLISDTYQCAITKEGIECTLDSIVKITKGKKYSEYSKLIKDTFDLEKIEKFNSCFKHTLNEKIRQMCEEAKTKKLFEAKFKKYLEFIEPVIIKLNS